MAKFKGAILRCLGCRKEFKVPQVRAKSAKYCSRNCKYQYWIEASVGPNEKGRQIEKECAKCKKKFKTFLSQNCRYCSYGCHQKSRRNREDRRCKLCKKIFNIKKSSPSVFCSWECRVTWFKRPKSEVYNVSLQEWYRARARALVRDDFICQKCGSSTSRMNVHHKIKRRDGGSHDIKNLITLCGSCHAKEHNHKRRIV